MVQVRPETAWSRINQPAEIVDQKSATHAARLFVAGMTGSQRVFAELLRLSAPDVERPGSYTISPAPYHKDIASWAGTTADVVARAIAHLMKAGLLVRYGSNLAITDRGKVEVLLKTFQNDD